MKSSSFVLDNVFLECMVAGSGFLNGPRFVPAVIVAVLQRCRDPGREYADS